MTLQVNETQVKLIVAVDGGSHGFSPLPLALGVPECPVVRACICRAPVHLSDPSLRTLRTVGDIKI